MATGTESRDAALDILRAVRTGQRFDRALDTISPLLPDADRRLAYEIAAGVLRERTALDRRIATCLTKPHKRMPDDVRDVLRIGVYQISYLDRVPPHAAVQTAVDLAKEECGERYAPFVNAVLRGVTRAPQTDGNLTTASSNDLAQRFSHPEWLVDRWIARFGHADTELLLRHNNTPPALVIQPARWTTATLQSALEAAGIDHQPGPMGYGFSVKATRVADLPGYAEGGFIVQDSAQRRLVDYIAAPSGARVWDACAAPGGKTAILAQTCRVVASDRSWARLGRLRANLGRAAPGALAVCADARFPPVTPREIDITVIDAPCSGTGTIARHPDARWRLSPEKISEVALSQAELVETAAAAVFPGRLLVYLTCSLEADENEQQVDGFLDRHSDFRRETEDLFVYPWTTNSDGGFGARLRRAA